MENLTESLIGLDADLPNVASEEKSTEALPSLGVILDDNTVESTSEVDKSNAESTSSVDTPVEIEPPKKNDKVNGAETDRLEEAKSNLSEFLKVDSQPATATINEFEDGIESAREKIIEDLMSTENTDSTNKDELLNYSPHFDVLPPETEKPTESKDANTEEVSMDIETNIKEPEPATATVNLNVEDKIKQMLLEPDTPESSKPSETPIPPIVTPPTPTPSTTSKDDIDTLLSTLMPDLENNKTEDAPTSKKEPGAPTIQHLREVLDKPEEKGTKRKLSTGGDEGLAKKAKLPNLPEVTLIKVVKKRRLSFDDLMSNLTKIKLPSSTWKVRISAGSNPFSIVEFHEKEKLIRSVKFFKDDFNYKVLFNNSPVQLLGAPQFVHSLEDVSVLLSIVNTLIQTDPVVHFC